MSKNASSSLFVHSTVRVKGHQQWSRGYKAITVDIVIDNIVCC